uniref:RNA-directed DNA polymerase, eukaryota, reverse transcriptase zinc-binding domain protein n=1 Tax=Tanacetum cinerariifolium TaxID=118510 RepID=A0A6L2L338_TANCI|nr:RNA-directed DNA polymerase, eukaryota, reverse transcriptase zinc-binding domain protein [Tanacetum cinerariifolium]
MGSYRTNEDDVAKISTSVYITNFLESVSAKELFHACKQYGHVVDSFILTKRSKNGKRFGYVRFINVFNEERLANVNTWGGNSYMGALKGVKQVDIEDLKSGPALLLGDDCVVSTDLSNALLGRVKEFASIANLKLALGNEGFVDITIKYTGELWVMLEFNSEETINMFRDNRKLLDVDDQDETSFHSKRLCIYMKADRSIVEEFKIIHQGKIYRIRANETPRWVPDFTDESDDDDQDEFNSNDDDIDIHKSGGAMDNNGVEGNKPMDGSVNKSGSSLKYPPRFTPIDGNGENFTPAEDGMIRNVEEVRTCNREENNDAFSDIRVNSYTKEAGTEIAEINKAFGIIYNRRSVNVKDTWKVSPCVGSNAMKILMGKLKFLKNHIRELSKTSTVSRKNVKAQYKRELQAVDLIINSGQGTEKEISTLKGDENFGFFHGMLNKKHSILNIQGVMVDGMWVDNPNKIHFDQQMELESEVTNDEIKKVVWECGTDKAPGPDGFTFGFFAVDFNIDSGQWTEKEISTRADIINMIQRCDKLDSMEMAQKAKVKWAVEGDENSGSFHGMLNKKRSIFNIRGVMVDGCNSSFIALIPKIPDANLVNDFRLSSLIGSTYKIIAKILTNQLVGVLGGIVNEVQSAFITDRQILDGPFILNEVFQWCKRKKQTLIFKVDFEKAYDSVRWDFLDDVLRKFGFGEKWRKWIQCCLQSSRGSIIINDSPTKEFQFGKGLKQGDPLSAFLFILIMESLHLSSQRVVDAGMFYGIKLDGLVNLSHMFYADDAVSVGQWSENNISTAANKLGCLVLKTPFLYPGSFVGGAMHRLQAWNDIVDRVKRHLSKWKMKMLSIGGRLTLVKSVLARRLHGFNGIRFLSQDTSLWARVIKAIHGGDGNIGAGTRSGTKSCWMNIVNEINVLSKKDINLMNFLRIKVGNGESTLFLEDVLCEGGKLKDRFPRAYDLESCKTITPVTLVLISDRWTCTLNSSGEFSVASVKNLIDVKIFLEGEHKTRWIRYVPIKVNTHAWKVMSNSLPTRFNFSRRVIDIDSITCVNCDMGVETTSHLFFTCDMAQQVARLIT